MDGPSKEQFVAALAILDEELAWTATVPDELSGASLLTFTFLRRARNVLKAAAVVSNAGLEGEIASHARVILEALYHVAWMTQSGSKERSAEAVEERARDIVDAQLLHMAKLYRILDRHDFHPFSIGKFAAEAEPEVRARRRLDADETFELKVGSLASEAGKDFRENYDLNYRLACLDAHPSLDAGVRALGHDQEDLLHERSLFIATISTMHLIDYGYPLVGRKEQVQPALERATAALGLPAGTFAKRT